MPRNPNAGGSGPKVTKQGKTGPIFGKATSLHGTTKPFSLNKGTNKNILKGSKKPGGR